MLIIRARQTAHTHPYHPRTQYTKQRKTATHIHFYRKLSHRTPPGGEVGVTQSRLDFLAATSPSVPPRRRPSSPSECRASAADATRPCVRPGRLLLPHGNECIDREPRRRTPCPPPLVVGRTPSYFPQNVEPIHSGIRPLRAFNSRKNRLKNPEFEAQAIH